MADRSLTRVFAHVRNLLAPRGEPAGDALLLAQFVARRDEAAFAELLRRHGPMVARVCRGVLRHEQDAEDAFQATFLVLARRAGSITRKEALASWLHAEYRGPLVLCYLEGRAQEDAARELGLSPGALRGRLNRGRGLLRKRLA